MQWKNSGRHRKHGRSQSPADGAIDRAFASSSIPQGLRAGAGVTLIELLCVIAIIAVLASLLLPVLARAYSRSRGWAEELEAEEVTGQIVKGTRSYRAGHSRYQFDSKSDFLDKCVLPPKSRGWVEKPATEFVPFNYLSPTNLTVLTFHIGRDRATLYRFTKGELSNLPK